MVGFCSDLKCIVFEYMHNGSLRDIFLRDILYARKTSRKRIRTLRWHDRIRVAAEVCSGLGFLHMARPKPIVHGHLRLSNILLDRNLVAKISGFGLNRNGDEQSVRSDIRAFGVLLMHLLTGRNWAGLVEAMAMDRPSLVRDLDEMAGSWPLDLAERLAGLALKCLSSNRGPNTDLRLATVMEELSDLRERAADVVAKGECEALVVGGSVAAAIDRAIGEDHLMDVPTCFLCPIFQVRLVLNLNFMKFYFSSGVAGVKLCVNFKEKFFKYSMSLRYRLTLILLLKNVSYAIPELQNWFI